MGLIHTTSACNVQREFWREAKSLALSALQQINWRDHVGPKFGVSALGTMTLRIRRVIAAALQKVGACPALLYTQFSAHVSLNFRATYSSLTRHSPRSLRRIARRPRVRPSVRSLSSLSLTTSPPPPAPADSQLEHPAPLAGGGEGIGNQYCYSGF